MSASSIQTDKEFEGCPQPLSLWCPTDEQSCEDRPLSQKVLPSEENLSAFRNGIQTQLYCGLEKMNVIVRYTLRTRPHLPSHCQRLSKILTFPTIFPPIKQKKAPASPKTPSGNHQNEPGNKQINPTSDIVPGKYQVDKCVMRAGHIINYVHPISAETPSRSYYVQTLQYVHSYC